MFYDFFRIIKYYRFDMILLCSEWFCYREKLIEWQISRKAYKKLQCASILTPTHPISILIDMRRLDSNFVISFPNSLHSALAKKLQKCCQIFFKDFAHALNKINQKTRSFFKWLCYIIQNETMIIYNNTISNFLLIVDLSVSEETLIYYF